MHARSKAEIVRHMAECPNYREDLDFIEEALAAEDVFIGQLNEQAGDSEVMHCITVGMFLYGLPELVFTGVPVHLVREVVSDLIEGHTFDREFLAGQRTKLIEGFQTIALSIDAPSAHQALSMCCDYYTLTGRSDLRAVQIVFADELGRFPWTSGYSEHDRQLQPIMGFESKAN